MDAAPRPGNLGRGPILRTVGESPMLPSRSLLAGLVLLGVAVPLPAADKGAVQILLEHEIIGPHQAMTEVQDYLDARIPRMPEVTSQAAWEKEADRLRRDV